MLEIEKELRGSGFAVSRDSDQTPVKKDTNYLVPSAGCVPCQKCKLHLSAENPFAKPVWWDKGQLVEGIPPEDKLSFGEWFVVVGEPPSKNYDTSGSYDSWNGLQKLMMVWYDLGILDKVVFLPVVRCYPPHVNGKAKISHTQLNHCLKLNWEVIRRINPKVIFALGYDACKAFTKRGDDFNIGGRVYHWSMDGSDQQYAVIPMWGMNYVNRDLARFQKPYVRLWKKTLRLVESSNDLSTIRSETEYVLAMDAKSVDEWFAGASLDLPFGFDFETTSLTHLGVWDKNFSITCVSFAHPDKDKPLVFPLDYPLIGRLLDELKVPHSEWKSRYSGLLEKLREILENPKVRKIIQNAKFDISAAWRVYGITLKGYFQDTMLLNYILHPDVKRLNGLDDLVRKYLPSLSDYHLVLDEYFDEHPDLNREYALLPHELLFPYAALDTQILFQILDELSKEIEKREENINPTFVRISENSDNHAFPTYSLAEYATYCRSCHLQLAVELEKNGIAVDREVLIRVEKHYIAEQADIAKKLEMHKDVVRFEAEALYGIRSKSKSGKPKKVKNLKMNWKSTQEVAAFFYDFCNLPVYYTTDAGNPSTDEASLTKLSTHNGNEVAKLLLKHREVSKFVDGFISKLTTEDKAENLISTWDGRVHSSFNISDTGTGRLSSSKPNMTQIPVGGHVKRVYCSRHPQGWLIQRDYSQLEVRVMALLSRDKSLVEAFLKNQDVHLKTQQFFFGDAADKNNKPQRVICKGAFFGWLYGQGDVGLFENLSSQDVRSPVTGEPITLDECAEFNRVLKTSYSGVSKWIQEVQISGAEGGVRSAFGFVRPLYHLQSYDRWVELKKKDPNSTRAKILGKDIQGDLRKAQNTPVQGTAADMCIFSGTRSVKRFKKECPDVKLCNIVHDSLWADAKNSNDAYSAVRILKDTMDNIPMWINELLPDYDASWIDLPVIGEAEIGLNAKDTFVVAVEPSEVSGESRMLLNIPQKVAETMKVDGELKGEGEKAHVLVDFMKYNDEIRGYLVTKRGTL